MRLLIAALCGLPLLADLVEVQPRRTRDYDERANQGWCSIRVWVDEEVNIFLEGERVMFETVRGAPARDVGTECSQPMPRGNALSDFQFKGIDGRGEVRLIEDPQQRNRYRAWVRIRDTKKGAEEHHFRLNWKNTWTQYGNTRGNTGSSGRDTRGGGRGGSVTQSISGRADASGRYFDERDRTWRLEGDGVCFYTDRDFRGDAFCSRVGEDRATIGRVLSSSYQSMRLFGRAREVEAFDQEDYRGASARLTREERDLGAVRTSRGDSMAGRVQSFRVR